MAYLNRIGEIGAGLIFTYPTEAAILLAVANVASMALALWSLRREARRRKVLDNLRRWV